MFIIDHFNNLINVTFMCIILFVFYIYFRKINYKKISNLIKDENIILLN